MRKEIAVGVLVRMALPFFLANMSIPRVGEWLEEVEYVELGEEEARALVQKYNKQGRDAGFGNLSHNQRRDFRSNRFQRFPPNRSKFLTQNNNASFAMTFTYIFVCGMQG